MKLIDADKLKWYLAELKKAACLNHADKYWLVPKTLTKIEQYTDSLQREQSKVKNGKFVFPKYLYARTKNNKTIDMSYAPQDMTAVEYIRNDFVEHEHPEVELEKEIVSICETYGITKNFDAELGPLDIKNIARHFYELGLNARKI